MLDILLVASAQLSRHAQPFPPTESLHPVRQELILREDEYPRYRRGYRGLPTYTRPPIVPVPAPETSPRPEYQPDLEDCTCPTGVVCIKC